MRPASNPFSLVLCPNSDIPIPKQFVFSHLIKSCQLLVYDDDDDDDDDDRSGGGDDDDDDDDDDDGIDSSGHSYKKSSHRYTDSR